MTPVAEPVRVLCVDDNEPLAEALRITLDGESGFVWAGWLPSADELMRRAESDRPDVILLDLDMPGRDPIEVLAELAAANPATRVVILSGHVRADLIQRVLQAGAWGYVSKNDGETSLLKAIADVAAGEIAFSPEVGRVYNQY
jgi:DNA-binding NarL/FixJ family response regulator